RVRREYPQPHAGGAPGLQEPQADLRDAVLQERIELPARGAGRVSFARNVVAGVPVTDRESGYRHTPAGHRAYRGVHALHAEPDHGILLLRATSRYHRARHYG